MADELMDEPYSFANPPPVDRAAPATVRGFLWQVVVTCREWISLTDDSVLLCEGTEDVDTYVLDDDGAFKEPQLWQLKDYSDPVNVRVRTLRESVANFAMAYASQVQRGVNPRFALSTTAARRRQRSSPDVLGLWVREEVLEEDEIAQLVQGVRNLCEEVLDEKRAASTSAETDYTAELQEAIDWFDGARESARWERFADSVSWEFEANGVHEAYSSLVEELENSPDVSVPGELIAQRLVWEVFRTSSQSDVQDRFLSRGDFLTVRSQSEELLREWAGEHRVELLPAWLRHEDQRIAAIEQKAETQEAKMKQMSDAISELRTSTARAVSGGPTSVSRQREARLFEAPVAIEQANSLAFSTYGEFLIAGEHFSRDEVTELLELLGCDRGPAVAVLAGDAGSGKSSVLLDCARHFESDPETTMLFLRADRLETNSNVSRLLPAAGTDATLMEWMAAVREASEADLSIIVVDQLDGLSEVSGASDAKSEFYTTLEQGLLHAAADNRTRILLGCRSFDLMADSRFRNLQQRDELVVVELGPLASETVKQAVAKLGYSDILTDHQLEFLSLPYHLELLEQLSSPNDTEQTLPLDARALYRSYWDTKARTLRSHLRPHSSWPEVLKEFTERTVRVGRRHLYENEVEDVLPQLEVLASHGVLRHAANTFSFFHERFGDYVFGRCFDGELATFVRANGQRSSHREQVRAVLTEKRERTLQDQDVGYLNALESLLTDPDILAHIRRVPTAMLVAVSDPMDGELDVVLEMLSSDEAHISRDAHRILATNQGFLALLDERGLLSGFL